ncbi:PTS fructose transporter subunit IIB [Photobacterium sp. BZF1]|uniref:protein-N(pi)-phosphohistidine--D-fructose phosphotransferase n=1 Tax=Photobacterium rosenbergii TaxID=294936 RepID=A0A2T3NMG0_9GAMM|nr:MULTISPECIES: PTS fructose transporter subunit IIB [Photobacterium]MBC7002206.1 PTS fructose transporter subunit IIB [Photobacterium sp. BZF1]MBY5944517.1 PTS fructose transporter subunit IIB [Photobacterium rosenbergii]MDV5168168.1 PTS fructose transporter subunit IIB [Photobacterium rosenbergii]PSW16669.1 PTS fructose transporter subunit IIB [Photobacterium rosenbergii]
MKIVAVTACPTGIAHTYMAASELTKAAQQLGVQMMVETQGAMGIENQLSFQDIGRADVVLIASDIEIEHRARFTGSKIHCVTIEEVLTDPVGVINRCKEL